jgi:hypothetical protein
MFNRGNLSGRMINPAWNVNLYNNLSPGKSNPAVQKKEIGEMMITKEMAMVVDGAEIK